MQPRTKALYLRLALRIRWRDTLEQNVIAGFCLIKLNFFYHIKQIDLIFLCFCTVTDHRRRHCVRRKKVTTLDFVS